MKIFHFTKSFFGGIVISQFLFTSFLFPQTGSGNGNAPDQNSVFAKQNHFKPFFGFVGYNTRDFLEGSESNSGTRYYGGMEWKQTSRKWETEGGVLVVGSSETSLPTKLYLKENANLQYGILDFRILAGRKSHRFPALFGKDGMEGLGLEWKNEFLSLRFVAYDHYRAFPLFEKEITPLPRISNPATGDRYRSAIVLEYTGDFQAGALFQYLDMGNWGNTAAETTNSRGVKKDSDYLWNAVFTLGWSGKYFEISQQFLFARGLDKTISNPDLVSRSYLISGEASFTKLRGKISSFQMDGFVFLPDANQTNSDGRITQLGFVGMGTHPGSQHFSSRQWNFYPSAWVTGNGLEYSESWFLGRRHSLWSGIELSFFHKEFIGLIGYCIFVPRLLGRDSLGEVSVQRSDYAKDSLKEIYLSFGFQTEQNKIFFRVEEAILRQDVEFLKNTGIVLEGGIFF